MNEREYYIAVVLFALVGCVFEGCAAYRAWLHRRALVAEFAKSVRRQTAAPDKLEPLLPPYFLGGDGDPTEPTNDTDRRIVN